MTTVNRRARGEVPAMILRVLAKAGASARFTPYEIAKQAELSPGSTTAATKRLIEEDKVVCYGTSPLVVGYKAA